MIMSNNNSQNSHSQPLRYRAFHQAIKDHFGERVDRITVNAGMTCPNIDGSKARHGCTFCQDASYTGLSLHEQNQTPAIRAQVEQGMRYVQERYPSRKFFAYFQNGTNTYESVDRLRKFYEEALSFPEVVGLFLSTRPDCVGPEVLDLLEEINQKTYLWVELGMPSHKEEVNRRLNRAHTNEDYEQAVVNLDDRKIRVCAHTILGLPGETGEEMAQKARYYSQHPIQGIKIHNLVVFKDTALAQQYQADRFHPFSLEDYTSQCIDFLEHLRPDILIQRLNAHGPRRETVAPEWSINKWNAINAIHSELERRDTWQGKKYQETL